MLRDQIVPSWLEGPPSSSESISPPVVTREQELPFHQLLWENFEKLCVLLVKLEAEVEHCQLYGKRGQNQKGIDIYARKKASDKYWVYQCKREQNFGPAKIEAAVKKFLAGEWANKAETLVLCTTESLVRTERADKLEKQNTLLQKRGINLLPWDCNTLSAKLKDSPDLVEDFFGPVWAESFCGQSKSSHPDKEHLEEIRNRYCQWIYINSATFNIAGLGLALPIAKAWVELDARDEEESENRTDGISDEKKQIEQYRQWSRKSEGKQSKSVKAEDVVGKNRVVITGGPGAGKSTLLKRLAHTFSHEGKLILWVRLPSLVKQMEGKTFEDALIRSSFDGSGLSGQEQRSISVQPDYLFADGLDECGTHRSEITDALIKWGHGHPDTAIIITTRPIGHAAASFSAWKHYSILPLPEKNIAQYAEQIIGACFQGDRKRTDQELKNFNNRITANKAAGLAARNPLLLGFLIQLSIGNIAFGSKRAAMYEQIIRCVLKDPADRLITVAPDEPLFLRLLEIIGWLLQHDFSLSYSDLLSAAGNILKDDLECPLLKARRSVEQAVKFWTEHRLVEKLSIAENEYLVFAHTTFGEFSAAKYALSLEEKDFFKVIHKKKRYSLSVAFIRKATRILLDEPYDPDIIVKVANVLGRGGTFQFIDELATIFQKKDIEKYSAHAEIIPEYIRFFFKKDSWTTDHDPKYILNNLKRFWFDILKFIISGISIKKVTCDNSPAPFMSLGKIWSMMELMKSFPTDIVKLNNENYNKESSLIVRCVISELGLKAEDVMKEANAAIRMIAREDFHSIYDLLPNIYITTDWNNVELAEAEKKIIAKALDHPSEIVARTAAEIIAGGAGGDETAEAVKEILRTGRDSALYHISRIASDIWRDKAPEIILHRLEDELTDGCQYLLENLPKISNDQYDDSISTTLLKELTHPNVEIAIGAAKGYANHHPAQAHLSELKSSLAYWKENEEPYPVTTGTIPSSPRETLVQIIDRLNGFTLSELAELCGDLRRDVQDVARDALLRLCTSDEFSLNDVVDLIQQEQASITLLAKLSELPPETLRHAEKQIVALLDSPVPELRTETLKILHGGWLADETACELAEKFLDDPDVHVRNQAVAALRKIESYEPA